MLVVKNVKRKVSSAKKNITIKDVSLEGLSICCNDSGDVTEDLLAIIPDGVDSIDIRISIDMPDESDDE